MPYDKELADRIRQQLSSEQAVTEQAMFGGLAFLIHGNMAIAASGQGGLLVRVDPEDGDRLIATTAAEPMEMRNRVMSGWLRIKAANVRTDRQLAKWVELATANARALPAKTPRKRTSKTRTPS